MAKEATEKNIKEITTKNYKGNVTMFIIGIFISAIGYSLLAITNQAGDDWASYVAPFSIVIGNIVVALSLVMDFHS